MKIFKSGPLSGLLIAGAMLGAIGTASAEPIRVGIANFGEHPQLNAAIAGFKEGMASGGFAEGTDVVYSESHTNFDASLVPQMIAKLQAENPKLILTVTTPVSLIAKKAMAGSGIPIVFSAVTDPVAAQRREHRDLLDGVDPEVGLEVEARLAHLHRVAGFLGDHLKHQLLDINLNRSRHCIP